MSRRARAGLYIHIPFCRHKCAYCDFASFAGLEHLHAAYVSALCRQAAGAGAGAWRDVAFDSVFLGGGTPTVLAPEQVAAILATCRARLTIDVGAEVTVEANPGTVDAAALALLREAGVNRLSLGVQSLRDDELRLLGRIHDRAMALQACRWAREAGFDNLNLDLIMGLPDQTREQWEETLCEALALRPEHLSLYILSLEEGTPLAARVLAGDLAAPDEETMAAMYEATEDLLAAGSYMHYEISNWARRSPGDIAGALPALACRHNLHYWRNERYLGLGAAAHSYDGATRCAAVRTPAAYIARVERGEPVVEEQETLDLAGQMGETMMLGLRLTAGVDRTAFRERFGAAPEEIYPREIAALVEDGLLEADARGLRLTRRGRLLGNRVFGEFLR